MPPVPFRRKTTFRERMLDSRNRRSANILDLRPPPGVAPLTSAGYGSARFAVTDLARRPRPDLNKPVEIMDWEDRTTIDPLLVEQDRQLAMDRVNPRFELGRLRRKARLEAAERSKK